MEEKNHRLEIILAIISAISAIIIAFITILPDLNQKTLLKKENISQETELEFINKYFFNIKREPYINSWNKLSESFIITKNMTYNKYILWWENKVKSVYIINSIKINTNIVEVKLKYNMKQNITICSKDIFILIKEKNKWLINNQQSKNIKCN